MQAVILVGGFGTRLRPLTRDVPKQMLPVVDRPMIEHVVAHLAAHGVTRVVLSLGFRPEAFSDAYPDGTCAGLPLHYAVEPEPLDTAGAVRFAALEAGIRATRGSGIGSGIGTGRGTDRATVSGSGSSSRDRTGSDHGGSDAFLVLNGDVLTDLDITAMVASHRAAGAQATLALTEVEDPSRYGVVPTDAEGRVLGFVEKPDAASAPSRWINAGTYVLEPSILDRIPAGRRVSIEYALIRDVNDQPWRADLLGKRLHGALGALAHVNLIPLNPTPGSEWDASPKPVEREFVRRVRERGVSCTVRDTRGREIAAACGQLAAQG